MISPAKLQRFEQAATLAGWRDADAMDTEARSNIARTDSAHTTLNNDLNNYRCLDLPDEPGASVPSQSIDDEPKETVPSAQASCTSSSKIVQSDGLEFVTNPKKFFKKGRVFATHWSEPRGITKAERGTNTLAEEAFTEMVRFVVLKPKATHSICLRISTYSGQATTKSGIVVADHAAVLSVGDTFLEHPEGEPGLTKDPIYIKVETPEEKIDSNSRINFGKPYTVEHNLRIRNIGRVVGDSLTKLDDYFAESMGITRSSQEQSDRRDGSELRTDTASTQRDAEIQASKFIIHSSSDHMSSRSDWNWSLAHNDYYHYTYGKNGEPVIHWARDPVQAPHTFANSGTEEETSKAVRTQVQDRVPAPSAPQEVRLRQPNFIAGNPGDGWYDSLDSSYRMRTGEQARQFFKIGRVFAMLYTEAAGVSSRRNTDNDDAFTVVRYGERVFTQIRRFVVVSVRRNFVQACAISTYANQGTLKVGCDPSEHAVLYNTGVSAQACYLEGERERGLYKEPIQVYPADSSAFLRRESRIRFGKVYSIEWNVKVKDIGIVVDSDLATLIAHYKEEGQRWD